STERCPILKRRMLAHQVLNDELYGQILEIIIGRLIAGIVAERKIERVPGRFDIGEVADLAWESAAADSAARGAALEIDIRRHGEGGIEVRLVIDKTGDAVGAVAPAEPRPVNHSRERL